MLATYAKADDEIDRDKDEDAALITLTFSDMGALPASYLAMATRANMASAQTTENGYMKTYASGRGMITETFDSGSDEPESSKVTGVSRSTDFGPFRTATGGVAAPVGSAQAMPVKARQAVMLAMSQARRRRVCRAGMAGSA